MVINRNGEVLGCSALCSSRAATQVAKGAAGAGEYEGASRSC